MMYQNKFVTVIKCGGKILREKNNNTIYLPFKAEYSMLLKNLHSRRVSVKVSIDSTDVLNGSSIVIEPNSEYELKGFLNNNNITNRFKFIQKTNQIINHKGDNVEDGIIRVEYAFEKPVTMTTTTDSTVNHHYYHHTTTNIPYYTSPFYTYQSPIIGSSYDGTKSDNVNYENIEAKNINKCFSSNVSADTSNHTLRGMDVGNQINSVLMENSKPELDEGITVKGSKINETLMDTWLGELEEPEVMIFNLKGATKKAKVAQAVTVKKNLKCETCGQSNPSSHNFCSNCSTSLI